MAHRTEFRIFVGAHAAVICRAENTLCRVASSFIHTCRVFFTCTYRSGNRNVWVSFFISTPFKKDLLGVQDDLLRFAYKLTSDREEANDLLQETSLKALDNEEKYTPDTNFKGWIYTIMRNIFINNYRKVVRDQTFVDTTDNLYHLNLPRDAAFESTESAYDLKEMHRIVNALPREYKIPFSMHVSGFKYREIAEKLGLPLGTVKSRIYFTRQKLQQDLKDFV